MSTPLHTRAWQAAQEFRLNAEIHTVLPFGHGIINDTYIVTTTADTKPKAVLQRINHRVFPQPVQIMQNRRRLQNHIKELEQDKIAAPRSLILPAIIPTHIGLDYFHDIAGNYWRMSEFIDDTHSLDTINSKTQAEEVGYALGHFHRLVSQLNVEELHDTLPGFHITPHYLKLYLEVRDHTTALSNPDIKHCLRIIEQRSGWANVLEHAKAQRLLALRTIHGDPKVNNILFHRQSGRAVSMIDLDTVKPGLIHYDIGDCLRSSCNTAGEAAGGESARFNVELCEVILQAYLDEAAMFMHQPDYQYLYDAIRLIPFELGLRFFTDYLQGNRYFKVQTPEQNLNRALTQFELLLSIESQQHDIKRIISKHSKF
jgi:hypothetical protein